jgi:hypothetical protein
MHDWVGSIGMFHCMKDSMSMKNFINKDRAKSVWSTILNIKNKNIIKEMSQSFSKTINKMKYNWGRAVINSTFPVECIVRKQ